MTLMNVASDPGQPDRRDQSLACSAMTLPALYA